MSNKKDQSAFIQQVACPACETETLMMEEYQLEDAKPKKVNLLLGILLVGFGTCMFLAGIGMAIDLGEPGAFFIYTGMLLLFAIPGMGQIQKYKASTRGQRLVCAECGHKWAVECPYCDSAKTAWSGTRFDRKKESHVRWFIHLVVGVVLAVIGPFMIYGGIEAWSDPNLGGGYRWENPTATGLQFFAMGVLALGGGLGAVASFFRSEKATAFRCEECYDKWLLASQAQSIQAYKPVFKF